MVQSSGTSLGKATKTKTTFKMEYSVSIDIAAKPDKIWSVLTQAQAYTQWNSTITQLDGNIVAGDTIKLKTKLDAKRTFKLKVSNVENNKTMTWSSGAAPMFKGVRTFTLNEGEAGSVRFTMREVFSGVMLPMIAGSLPDFTEAFEQFASDLKNKAEEEESP